MKHTNLVGAARARAIYKKTALSMLSVTPTLVAILGGAPAFAQTAPQTAQAPVEEVVVTGSRIVRDGYQAPTPVSVVSVDEIQNSGTQNIADYVNSLPALAQSTTATSNVSSAAGLAGGIDGLNLRALGSVRTLVLLDGQRFVGSVNTGIVDVSEFPQQLVSRVDVVTGGASAAYGSDALSGVVNFVLDTKFTGVKGEVSGGVTTYGDDRNWKVDLTAGTGFANDRGHFLISGEATAQDGILINNRPWNSNPGWGYITNPAYTATNGQPSQILLPQVGLSTSTLGGEIACSTTSACAALRGIAFGPGGTPYKVAFGSVVSDPLMSGGSWNGDAYDRDKGYGIALEPVQNRQGLFTRISYDVSDDWNVYLQGSWNHLFDHTIIHAYFDAGNLTESATNAFLPASVAAQAAALGITSFAFGTQNGDMGESQASLDHRTLRFVAGTNGKFTAFDTQWKLNGYLESGLSMETAAFPNELNAANFALAQNAVKGPNGAIVCASTLVNPNNGCVPYNLFGKGVNSQAALNYVLGEPFQVDRFLETVESVNVTGEPFSDWAGPISIATGVEHREESARGIVDPTEGVNGAVWQFAPGAPPAGKFTVTEGYVETVIPLAKDMMWAKSLDINGAIRATGYESGTVATGKAGVEYAPIDDIRFRATKSRDVREPNLNELYAGASFLTSTVTNPFNNNAATSYKQETVGNPALVPEVANTTGAGVVLQPTFIPGFNASFDYYNISISHGINTLTAQQEVNLCFSGNQSACSLITQTTVNGAPQFTNILVSAINLASEKASGFDIEASYQFRLEDIVTGWGGKIGIRALATHYINDTITSGVPGSIAYQNVGIVGQTGGGPPRWRTQAAISYSNDPITVTLSMRGVSSGVYNTTNVECTSGCPASTVNNVTVSNNQVAGATYFDLATSYKLPFESAQTELFLNVRNITNKDPAVYAPGPGGSGYVFPNAAVGIYDVLGRVFRAGVRFKM